MTLAYHFVGTTLCNGDPVPPDGVWLCSPEQPVMCESGLHASRTPWQALQYAPGPILCLVDVDHVVREDADKLVCWYRWIYARFDATDMLLEHARQSALSVIQLWNAPDVVREYLETGDEKLRAAAEAAAWDARDAAWAAGAATRAAAGTAAWVAARTAAEAAAWAAAMSSHAARFNNAVYARFRAMGYGT